MPKKIAPSPTNLHSPKHSPAATRRLLEAVRSTANQICTQYSTVDGLAEKSIPLLRQQYGANRLTAHRQISVLKQLLLAFINPFTTILLIIALVSFFLDYYFAAAEEKNLTTVMIVTLMVLISGFLRFIQETRSSNAAEKLRSMVRTTATVERQPRGRYECDIEDLVVGDKIYLAAGDMLPADTRIIRAKDLFISQSTLTGESEPLEKIAAIDGATSILEAKNLALMGSNVVSGSAEAIVLAVGDDTQFGRISQMLSAPPIASNFEKGVNSVSWVLIRFMLVMAPAVLLINGFTKGDWEAAFFFALSIIVGLMPEMLPVIVTTCLAKGAVAMSHKKTIIKNINSMQNFGAMDVLCTDKTGTLTQDKVALEICMNVHGEINARVFRHAFLNSYYQTGLHNLMDIAIIEKTREELGGEAPLRELTARYEKVDEIPFDFSRRRMSVVVANVNGKKELITKGAVEEVMAVCTQVEYQGKIENLTAAIRADIRKTVDRFSDNGMRVIAVAQKVNPHTWFSPQDECAMTLIGYLAFLDPPKTTTATAIKTLAEYGVATKILTGDNERVTSCICKQVGLRIDRLLLGSEIARLSAAELAQAVETTNVFAKLSPEQKAQIVEILRANGHTVGFMGDGINDAPAMRAADVGISVDTAVDIAKESADIILLEKDLMILEAGIIEGRKTYANMIKYIKLTTSCNFGNMFSVLLACAFLPFLPMLSVQLLLRNLLYDTYCTALPWDNVDLEYLRKPRNWDASSVSRFMLYIGPTSSLFDIAIYCLMFFVIGPELCGGAYSQLNAAAQIQFAVFFQTGWFLASMSSQMLVVYVIRTARIPFFQSWASRTLLAFTLIGITLLTIIPYTAIGAEFGLSPLPPIYFAYSLLAIIGYLLLTELMKKIYLRRFGELL